MNADRYSSSTWKNTQFISDYLYYDFNCSYSNSDTQMRKYLFLTILLYAASLFLKFLPMPLTYSLQFPPIFSTPFYLLHYHFNFPKQRRLLKIIFAHPFIDITIPYMLAIVKNKFKIAAQIYWYPLKLWFLELKIIHL